MKNRGWHAEHNLRCQKCKHLFVIQMSIKEAGEGNWPPCPECGGTASKVFVPHEIRYVAEGFTQRNKINKETEPLPGAYEPLN